MNEPSPSGFCVNCGAPMSAETKFCVNCGAERVAAPPVDDVQSRPPPVAPTPVVPTPTVPTPAAALPTVEQPLVAAVPPSSPPPPGSTRSPNRNRAIVAGAIAGLVIAGAAGFAWAKSSDSNHKTSVAAPLPTSAPFTSPTTPTTPLATEPPTTRFTPAPTVLDMRSVVSQLDATLNESAVQVEQLKRVIDQYVSCELPGADAAGQLQTVVNGRRQIGNDLDQVLATTSGAGRELATLLRKAINFSLQADTFYQASMQNNSATDASVPCHRENDANWVSARSIDPLSSRAKQDFLAQYLPWAARVGFPSNWQPNQF